MRDVVVRRSARHRVDRGAGRGCDGWCAACRARVIGCSDDGFEYFRCWLIARGEQVFRDALVDPETLVDRAEPEVEGEGLPYAAAKAYEPRAGAVLSEPTVCLSEPAGEPWEEDDLEELFPKLWARFG